MALPKIDAIFVFDMYMLQIDLPFHHLRSIALGTGRTLYPWLSIRGDERHQSLISRRKEIRYVGVDIMFHL
jgi:hypothetical protein